MSAKFEPQLLPVGEGARRPVDDVQGIQAAIAVSDCRGDCKTPPEALRNGGVALGIGEAGLARGIRRREVGRTRLPRQHPIPAVTSANRNMNLEGLQAPIGAHHLRRHRECQVEHPFLQHKYQPLPAHSTECQQIQQADVLARAAHRFGTI